MSFLPSTVWRQLLTPRSIHALFVAAAMHGTLAAQTPGARDPHPSGHAGDAYLVDTARRLVLGLKAARDTARLAIDAYTAVIRERMGMELPTPQRAIDHGCTASARPAWASSGGEDFYALGAGLVFMEGILRLDAARGLGRGRQGAPEAVLRLHLWADSFF